MNRLERIRTLTIDEVNERLPLLMRIVEDVMATWKEREQVRKHLSLFRRERQGSGSVEVSETIARLEDNEFELAAALVDLEQEVNELGGIIKHPGSGLVDFFCDLDGHLVFVSWRPGDAEIRFWHEIDEDVEHLREIEPDPPVRETLIENESD